MKPVIAHILVAGMLLAARAVSAQESRAELILKEAEQLEKQDNSTSLRLAMAKFDELLAAYRADGNRKGQATALTHIGGIYRLLGEQQKALGYFKESLLILRELGERQSEGRVMSSIGVTYFDLGEYQKAMEFFTQAVPVAQAVGDKSGEARALAGIGLAYHGQGSSKKAIDYYEQALIAYRAAADRLGEAQTLNNLGVIYHYQMNELEKALDYYNRALELKDGGADKRGEVGTLNNIAAIYHSMGQTEKALETFKKSVPIFHEMGDRQGEIKALAFIACATTALGRFDEARSTIESALEMVEARRAGLDRHELRASYFATMRYGYDEYIAVLMELHRESPQKGFEALALQVSERARARSLIELLSESNTDVRRGVDAKLLERERSLRQLLNAKAAEQARLVSSNHAGEEARAVGRAIDALATDYQEVQSQIRLSSPNYAALTHPQLLTLKDIQEQLDADTLLLEYALTDDRSYLWAVSTTTIRSYQLPKRAEVEAAAIRFYDLLKSPDQGEKIGETSAELSRMILGPVAAELGSKRLLIIADGALHYVPFAALNAPDAPAGSRPLILDHEIVNLPSISALAVLRHETAGRKSAGKAVAVLADPVFSSDDARVQNTERGTNRLRESLPAELKRAAEESGMAGVAAALPRLIGTRREAASIITLATESQRLQ